MTSAESMFREVLDAHGAAIRRLCAAYEADPARRDELQQEVCVALFRALPRFRGDASRRTFVFRVAHNVAIKHVRSAAREPGGVDLHEDVAHEAPSVVHAIDAAQRREALLRAIRRLRPEVDRQIALLHLEGLDHASIASVVGLSSSNVGTRLSRIRTRLRRALGDRDA